MPIFINKNSKRKVIHKLSSSNIKKNPNIEKEHIITKFKKNEKKYLFYSVSCFLIFSLIIIFFGCMSLKSYLSLNDYTSGDLIVSYSNTKEGVSDIITLTDADVLEDSKVKDESNYNFIVNNQGKKDLKYQIRIREDKDFIKLDECFNKLFDSNDIKYNINRGSIFYLGTKEIDGNYILLEDIIKKNTSKVYSMNIWVDKSVKLNDRHFHGIIEVKLVD